MTLPIPTPLIAPVPAGRMPVDVCPHCKRSLTVHTFATDEYVNRTYHCTVHGDVAPMRSIIINEY